jgi:hypothetical protein
MTINKFFAELKRRNVLKVALVYAVVSWLLIELAWILLPTLDAPEWMLRAFIVLVALGFVITGIISWSFEMTPEGLKRTAEITPSEVLPYWSKRKFTAFIVGVAAIAFGLLAFQMLRLAPAFQHVSTSKRTDKIFIQGNQAGTQTVERQPDGAMRAEYSYNDRGRGDHIIAIWKLDSAGVPTEYQGHGNDYMKAPLEEHFEIKNGRANWKNRSEQGEQAVSGEAFYLPMNAPPEFFGVLARALLKAPNHKMPLLPAGEATIEKLGKVTAGNTAFTEYRITGLGFSPQPIWLDRNGTSASVSPWFSVVPDGSEEPHDRALPEKNPDDLRDIRPQRFHNSDFAPFLHRHCDERAHDSERSDDHDEEQQEKHHGTLEPHRFEKLTVHVDPSLRVFGRLEKLFDFPFYALSAVRVVGFDSDPVQRVAEAV